MKKIFTLVLLINFIFSLPIEKINTYKIENLVNRNECEGFSQDECEYLDYCEWVSDSPNMPGMCGQIDSDDGPPDCLLDCAGLEYLGPDANSDELCDWIISINGTECIEDCEEEIFIGFELLAEACYSCLSDENLDCADIFDDSDNDDFEDDCRYFESEDECIAAGCEWGDEDGCYGNWDEEEEYLCSDLGYEECSMTLYCEWVSDSPNMPGMCVESEDDFEDDCRYFESEDECIYAGCEWSDEDGCYGDWDDDNEEEYLCSDLGYEECSMTLYCEWVSDSPNMPGMCVESGNDDNGPPECLLDCIGIDNINPDENPYEACDWIITLFGFDPGFNSCLQDCDEETMIFIDQFVSACYDCLEQGNCEDVFDDDSYECEDFGYDECMMSLDCEWTSDSPNMPGMCVEIDNEECNENMVCAPVLTCIDNLLYPTSCGPDNCDEPIDECDNDNNSNCEDLGYNECFMTLGCEWGVIIDGDAIFETCIESNIDPVQGCWEGGELYCYGCEVFINECQYYECTTQGWTDLYTIDSDECNNGGDFIGAIHLGETNAVPGSLVEIELSYQSMQPIAGLQFTIIDNPDWLYGIEFISNYDCFESSFNEVNGSLIAIMFSFTGCSLDPAEEFINFGSIQFQLSDFAEFGSTIELNVSDLIASDPTGNALEFEGLSGLVNIGGLLGDINNDNELNVLDIVSSVSFILQIDVPNDIEFYAADYNQDGELNVLDVVSIVNYILFGNDIQKSRINKDTAALLKNNVLTLIGDIGGVQFEGSLITNVISTDILSTSNQYNIIYNLNGTMESKRLEFLAEPMNLIVSDINGQNINIRLVDDFELNNAYPNPFNPITNISYTISENTHLSINIYDISGNLIDELINQEQSVGTYNLMWNAEGYPSGVYFVKLDAGDFTQTQKLMLVK